MKRVYNTGLSIMRSIFTFLLLPFAFSFVLAQTENPPAPSAPRSINVPAVRQKKLPNGLTVAVVERKNVPLVTVQLLIRSGASAEELEKAGLANMTAGLLTKGTKTKTATQVAEGMEFLGGSINTGAGWNNSNVTVNVMADKIDQAMAIMADVVLNPAFAQKELELLKSQTMDGLTNNLKQPGFLATYVASRYSFQEHPAGGMPDSINGITRKDIQEFHKSNYFPGNAVVIFTGDITAIKANALTAKYFGRWKGSLRKEIIQQMYEAPATPPDSSVTIREPEIKRILVVDLPNSGQASVNYAKRVDNGRLEYGDEQQTSTLFFPSIVLNSVLGGGYSSRLNQEIRIKRGLSYGAGSGFAWRDFDSNFSTRTQTKNESAAEVAELVLAEIKKLGEKSVGNDELVPRKAVLTGNFGQTLETTGGLAGALADLLSFDLRPSELNAYMRNVNSVTSDQIRDFASDYLLGGDFIIVGDYAIFEADLKKRFPNMMFNVIKADELDLSKDSLRK